MGVLRRRHVRLMTCLLMAVALALPGWSVACSRPIRVPVAALGLSVKVANEGFSGVYPDLLRSMNGCSFVFESVPRARQEAMFENGRADLLIPASGTARRDQYGVFVPLLAVRANLLSLDDSHAPVNSLKELKERRELRVALVRGFDYGEAYQDLLQTLKAQNRLSLNADVASVARMLSSGAADVTVMVPSILVGSMVAEPRFKPLVSRLRYEILDDLPWMESGAYISKTAVSDADRALLREMLERAAKNGAVWAAFQRYYPAGALNDSIKPR